MLKDAQSLLVTTDSTLTLTALDNFAGQQRNLREDSEEVVAVFEAAKADPTCAMANAFAGIIHIRLNAADAAKPFLEAAKEHARAATERERLFVSAIDAWARGDFDAAIEAHERIADEYPADIFSVQLCCTHKFYARKDPEGALRIMQSVMPANGTLAHAHGFLSFMLEEARRFEEAEASGRKAVQMDRGNVMGQHTVAHVMEAQGRFKEGVEWLEQFPATWDLLNESFYPHMWMHLALFYLETSSIDRVLEICDNNILGRYRHLPPAQLYAANVVARAELTGTNVGTRWQQLAGLIENPAYEATDPLTVLHILYVLARAGRDVTSRMSSMEDQAKGVHPTLRGTWLEVVLPVAQALIAFSRRDYETTWRCLAPIIDRFAEIGGSDVERALFAAIWLEALIRTRRFAKSVEVLESLRLAKGEHPRVLRQLADAYDGLGRVDEAMQARRRAVGGDSQRSAS